MNGSLTDGKFMIETADRFHGPSETCEIYGVDCVGDQTIPDQLINYISLLLNQIWKSDKNGDFLESVGYATFILSGGEKCRE